MSSASWINCGTAIFAIAAAILWFLSAKVKIPDSFPINVVSGGLGALGGPIGGGPVSFGHSVALTDLAMSLKQQSQLSAYAAICAGLSASLGAVAVAVLIGSN